MPVWIAASILGALVTTAAGYLIDKTGEAAHDTGQGVNEASTGAVKVVLAAAAAFYVLKKTKVI